MSTLQSTTIPQEQFLRIATNLLYKVFLEAARTDAKKIYRSLDSGDQVPLTRVQMEDKSEVRFDLSMDKSQYQGRLNFTGFRNGVALLVNNLNEQLKNDQQIQVYSAESAPEQLIFGVLGVTRDGSLANVLALGADTSASDDAMVELKLLYLDPAQFTDQSEAVS